MLSPPPLSPNNKNRGKGAEDGSIVVFFERDILPFLLTLLKVSATSPEDGRNRIEVTAAAAAADAPTHRWMKAKSIRRRRTRMKGALLAARGGGGGGKQP